MSTATAERTDGMAVVTRGLRKTYPGVRGRRVAVQGLDLDVPAGGVHGFLGPNGSGKTTTIRMLLGLARADSGTMHVFGTPVPQRLPEVVGRVGAIVESPTFFPTFSGERSLTLLADAIGTPRSRVGEVLEQVGLGGRGKDPFRAYSWV
ncbi:ATP-binding cassette domain-containing protein [Ornithinimicrobium sp. CNJ-824]|uniref:ATP-binding cassette domain-containing protein n=1 Tax=Ornithinimicrobium sp. CNJ-824 TaxID=1904966 RepID=UPI000A421C53